jgi:hypothetical protein
MQKYFKFKIEKLIDYMVVWRFCKFFCAILLCSEKNVMSMTLRCQISLSTFKYSSRIYTETVPTLFSYIIFLLKFHVACWTFQFTYSTSPLQPELEFVTFSEA